MKRRLVYAILLIVISSTVLPVRAGSISTGRIIEETISPFTLWNCMDWALTGICVWVDCGVTGCSIKISPKFGNFTPDLVVSSYHRVGDNPWNEMAKAYGPVQRAAGQGFVNSMMPGIFIGEGNRPNEKFHRSHEDLRFKESDAIGNPVTRSMLFAAAISQGVYPVGGESLPIDEWLICPKETHPFIPYLLSTLDYIAWRMSIPESFFPDALIPGRREIGDWPRNTWQAVYPRSGFTMQSEDPKAGAVVAQRAGDIVTRINQLHVYQPTSLGRNSQGLKVWWPGPLYERRCRTGRFQMMVPLSQHQCETFGRNDTTGSGSWADDKTDEEGDYVWNLWRPVQCCRRRGDWLISVINFRAWPAC